MGKRYVKFGEYYINAFNDIITIKYFNKKIKFLWIGAEKYTISANCEYNKIYIYIVGPPTLGLITIRPIGNGKYFAYSIEKFCRKEWGIRKLSNFITIFREMRLEFEFANGENVHRWLK